MEVVVERPEPMLLEQLQAVVETERQREVSLHHAKGEALGRRGQTGEVKVKQGQHANHSVTLWQPCLAMLQNVATTRTNMEHRG